MTWTFVIVNEVIYD